MTHLANLGHRVEADGFPHPVVDYRRSIVHDKAVAFSDGLVGDVHFADGIVRTINGQLGNNSTAALLTERQELI